SLMEKERKEAEAQENAAVPADVSFELNASEEELLEEFGVLMAAEYNYGVTRLHGQWILPPDVTIDMRHAEQVPQGEKLGQQTRAAGATETPKPEDKG